MNYGDSITQVRKSSLFNAASTTFVEGPTQRTLARYDFAHRHQLVLIDGPHGYPFPDAEYCSLYPTIDVGGLLIVDDILIPSVGRMFEIIRAEDMFELLEIVNGNTAFFRRTNARLIDPEGDDWWLQGYNRSYYQQVTSPRHPSPAQRLQSRFASLVKRRMTKKK